MSNSSSNHGTFTPIVINNTPYYLVPPAAIDALNTVLDHVTTSKNTDSANLRQKLRPTKTKTETEPEAKKPTSAGTTDSNPKSEVPATAEVVVVEQPKAAPSSRPRRTVSDAIRILQGKLGTP